MHTLTLCSFKGGTAKTSTALHIGAALAKFHRKRVLLVDFDPQANLSTGLGFGTDCERTLVPVLQEECLVDQVIQHTHQERLDIICANTYLDQVEMTAPLVRDPYAHERLRVALKSLDYDFCLIDTPPSLGWLTQSAFFAAQHTLICAVPEPYSVLALDRLAKYHQAVNRNHKLSVLGVVLSLYDARGATNQAFADAIDEAFRDKLFRTRIRRDVSINRAILQGRPVFDCFPRSRAGTDYKQLTQEILRSYEHLHTSQELPEAVTIGGESRPLSRAF